MRAHTQGINLALIADNRELASLVDDMLLDAGVSGRVDCLLPGSAAIKRGLLPADNQDRSAPDLLLFDFTEPNEANTAALRDIAFSAERATIPVILLMNASSQHLLHAENICGDSAIMFSPTPLRSFLAKMRDENRTAFLKAVATLYEYGPILVQVPGHRPAQNSRQRRPVEFLGARASCA